MATDFSVERIFHPVGQGAFYTEKIGDKYFVYDCGTLSGKKVKAEVEDMIGYFFSEQKVEIEILFISHFHEDHISMIDKLKNTTSIKKVVLPVLHNNYKIIFLSMLESKGTEKSKQLYSLIKDPREYFKGSIIISVEQGNGEQQRNDSIMPLEKIKDHMTNFPSNEAILVYKENSSSNDSDISWVMAPYNTLNQNVLNIWRIQLRSATV